MRKLVFVLLSLGLWIITVIPASANIIWDGRP